MTDNKAHLAHCNQGDYAGSCKYGDDDCPALAPSEADKLITQFGYWGEHPDHPVEDWQYEVSCNDTRAGYWEWVASKIEEDDNA